MNAHEYMRQFILESAVLCESPQQFSLFKKFKLINYIYDTAKRLKLPSNWMREIEKTARKIIGLCLEELKKGYYQWLVAHATPPGRPEFGDDDDYSELDGETVSQIFMDNMHYLTDYNFTLSRMLNVDVHTGKVWFFGHSFYHPMDVTVPVREFFSDIPVDAIPAAIGNEEVSDYIDREEPSEELADTLRQIEDDRVEWADELGSTMFPYIHE